MIKENYLKKGRTALNFKSKLQEAQDIIHQAHFHLKQVNSNSIESEACHFAQNELEKAQQIIQQVQQQIHN
ncbi:hypothetical protein DZB84_20890 [Bacillus sp. HNG]|uniref:hypothetical protein n=1 Tax=Bacillus sp. HNG TaxID=2293325 RepID=UPI000E2FE240|nr:hypothetical protein [Bacillus sp. HNG]RFB11391.1 hypothetical protein DZB84_20890 [Bacillus sp. HNG]